MYQFRSACRILRAMDIQELYVTISREIMQLDKADDKAAQTSCLRAIQVAMDQYKAKQTKNDFRSLREFFERDGVHTASLPELEDLTSEGIEITARQETPLRLFFDNTSTVMLAGEVLLEEGLSSPEDAD